MIAEQTANEEDSSSPAITRLADAYHDASSLLSPGQQPVITMIAEKSSEAAPEEGRDPPKKTSQERVDTLPVLTGRVFPHPAD
jgi:hypothetical protein